MYRKVRLACRDGMSERAATRHFGIARESVRKMFEFSVPPGYHELLEHYGLRGSKNTPGRAHENGDVESSHRGMKNALDQRLRLRGSHDFESVKAYWHFVEALVSERNGGRLAEERAVLRELPIRALVA